MGNTLLRPCIVELESVLVSQDIKKYELGLPVVGMEYSVSVTYEYTIDTIIANMGNVTDSPYNLLLFPNTSVILEYKNTNIPPRTINNSAGISIIIIVIDPTKVSKIKPTVKKDSKYPIIYECLDSIIENQKYSMVLENGNNLDIWRKYITNLIKYNTANPNIKYKTSWNMFSASDSSLGIVIPNKFMATISYNNNSPDTYSILNKRSEKDIIYIPSIKNPKDIKNIIIKDVPENIINENFDATCRNVTFTYFDLLIILAIILLAYYFINKKQ